MLRAQEEYARHDWDVLAAGAASSLLRRGRDGVLLATGRSFDVIEVGARLGHTAHTLLRYRDSGCPTAVTPAGRWLFFVRTGTVLPAALAGRPDVIRHSAASAVPAPPSRYRRGEVRWVVPPDRTRWAPGDPADVQRALATAAVAVRASDERHHRPWWALAR
jgi:hypothetical protein